jgi:hypothetical protein
MSAHVVHMPYTMVSSRHTRITSFSRPCLVRAKTVAERVTHFDAAPPAFCASRFRLFVWTPSAVGRSVRGRHSIIDCSVRWGMCKEATEERSGWTATK